MQLRTHAAAKYAVRFASHLLLVALALTASPAIAGAQTQTSTTNTNSEPYRIYRLKYISSPNGMNDVVTNLRAMLRRAQFYGNYATKTISIRGTPEDIQTAEKILDALDTPLPAYRLQYTITDMSGSKPTASRSFEVTALAGQAVAFKQGDSVPVSIGKADMTYMDVGYSISATLNASGDSLVLQSEVKESAVAQESVHAQNPVIHQTVLSNVAPLTAGKPQVLGSIDIPGATRKEQIEVTAEAIGGR